MKRCGGGATRRSGGSGSEMADRLVERMRGTLEAGYWPRVHCLLLVGLSSGAAFLLSVALLDAARPLDGAALRAGRARRLRRVPGAHPRLGPVGNGRGSCRTRTSTSGTCSTSSATCRCRLPRDQRASRAAPSAAAARAAAAHRRRGTRAAWCRPHHGRRRWGAAMGASRSISTATIPCWPIVVLVAAFAGLAAIGYVIYVAPTLLAEAAVNAAVAGKVYSGLKKREPHHWTTRRAAAHWRSPPWSSSSAPPRPDTPCSGSRRKPGRSAASGSTWRTTNDPDQPPPSRCRRGRPAGGRVVGRHGRPAPPSLPNQRRRTRSSS